MINTWDVTALCLKEISSRDYEHRGGYKRDDTRTSLWREKIQIIGAEEIHGLPRGFLFGMVTPLNLVEVNCPSPHYPIKLTQ
jgi:hypothetical protein